MNRSNTDYSYLFRGWKTPLVTVLVTVALLAGSGWYYQGQKRSVDSRVSSQVSMQGAYAELMDRKRMLVRYREQYADLKAIGFVGYESRLDWVAAITDSAERLLLPSVSYSIEAQRAVAPPMQLTAIGGDVQIFASSLALEIGLVHELDLVRFVEDLQKTAPGLMKVDQCELSRQFDSRTEIRPGLNIRANCTIHVFSVITSDAGHVDGAA